MNQVAQKLLFALTAIGLGVAVVPVTDNVLTGVAVGAFVMCLVLSIRLPSSGRLEVEKVGSILLNFGVTVVVATTITAIYCVLITMQSPGPNQAWYVVGVAAAIYGGVLSLGVSAVCASIAVIVLLLARRHLA